ncbi:MAG: hypothetical protein AAF560_30495, partial [Acidobacteriota bacterium]
GTHRPLGPVTARAQVFDVEMELRFAQELKVEVAGDVAQRVFTVPELDGLSTTYFLDLALTDSAGVELSRNFYVLSTQADVLDWNASTYYHTPVKTHADLTGLSQLPPVELEVAATHAVEGDEGVTRVRVENPTGHLAYAVHLRLMRGENGEEVLPILWQDNYFPLLPGESREIEARYKVSDLAGASPVVEVGGWNVAGSGRHVP